MSAGDGPPPGGRSETEDWLRLAIDAAGMASWNWDLATGRIVRSEGMAQLFGLPPGALDDPTIDPLDRVHPDDRPLIDDMDLRHLVSGDPYVVEYRVLLPGGTTRWLREQGHFLPDPAGGPGCFLGVTTDVTDRKNAEEALRAAEQKFRVLVEQLPAIAYVCEIVGPGSVEWTYHYMSPRVEEILGYPAEEWMRDPGLWWRCVHPDDIPLILEEDNRTERSGEPYRVEHRMIARDGRVVWIRDEARLVEGTPGAPRVWQGVMIDVTDRKEAQAALDESEARYRALIEALPAVVYRTAPEGPPVTYISPQVQAMFGYSTKEWYSDPGLWGRIIHRADRARAEAELARSLEDGQPFALEYRVVAQDGRVVWVRDETRMVRDDDGRPLYRQGLVVDVTERRRAVAARRKSAAEFRLLFAANPLPMWVFDRATLRFLEVNDAALAHYGYSRDEFLAMTIDDIRADSEAPAAATKPAVRRQRGLNSGVSRHRLRDGHLIDVETTTHALDFGGRAAALVVAQDVTARKVLEARLARQAFFDLLTGLPNRALFLDRLGQALARRGRCAVLFLDLDDFKVVNDTLGHDAGDRLLAEVAERFRSVVGSTDTLARLGGDEFALLAEEVDGSGEAARLADALAASLRAPFKIEGRDLFVSVSIGIATQGRPGGTSDRADPEDLLRLADLAMYRAKQQGKGRVATFDPSMAERAWQRLELEGELRRALDAGEFRLVYQPIVDLHSGRIASFEALIRWAHPVRGLVAPDAFIPLAEESGLVVPLGRWALREACREAASWVTGSEDPLPSVSVNLSPRQFQASVLLDDVSQALRDSGLPSNRLELEVTEETAMEHALETIETMRSLRALGVRLAVDDFGVGYAGPGYLRHCPLDGVKIDRSFVAGYDHDKLDHATVRAVLAFAEAMGLEVTAEGIETEEQWAHMRRLGCHRGQGFWFAPPLAAGDLAEMLATGNVRARVRSAVAD